jgi:hypothetical protein
MRRGGDGQIVISSPRSGQVSNLPKVQNSFPNLNIPSSYPHFDIAMPEGYNRNVWMLNIIPQFHSVEALFRL